MWNLDKPPLDASISDLSEISQHSRTLAAGHFPAVKTLYTQYDSQQGSVTDAQHAAVPSGSAKALRRAYDKTYRKGDHAAIRAQIMSGISKCPMCGVGNATTLDHYMEKESYNALSMMRQNLVPMCRDCNSIRFANKLGHTDFIHAYYDRLPADRQWLKVNLIFGAGAVSADFYADAAILTNPILYHKACETIRGLEFNETVAKELPSFISSILPGDANRTDEIVRAIIRDMAGTYASRTAFGLNHWKTVLLKALADLPELKVDDLKAYI